MPSCVLAHPLPSAEHRRQDAIVLAARNVAALAILTVLVVACGGALRAVPGGSGALLPSAARDGRAVARVFGRRVPPAGVRPAPG